VCELRRQRVYDKEIVKARGGLKYLAKTFSCRRPAGSLIEYRHTVIFLKIMYTTPQCLWGGNSSPRAESIHLKPYVNSCWQLEFAQRTFRTGTKNRNEQAHVIRWKLGGPIRVNKSTLNFIVSSGACHFD